MSDRKLEEVLLKLDGYEPWMEKCKNKCAGSIDHFKIYRPFQRAYKV